MKRFTVLAVALTVFLGLVVSANAADFSGKWINYRMFVEQNGEKMEVNMEEGGASDDDLGYIEFKEGKFYQARGPWDDALEFTYKAEGEKLIVDISEEEKANGIALVEICFEGDDLVYVVVAEGEEGGTMRNYFRRPK
ncbi:hypothetical protein LJC31_04920 [Synergistaceae bacterium OttesenSCG-928-I11]|nr:hypothetical protein [Synergistaceae bacterium OttesenSCG-928-I11]